MEETGARPRRPPPPRILQQAIDRAQEFNQLHNLAFTEVNAALSYDERQNGEQALLSYKRGVELMQQALDLDLGAISSEDTLSDINSKKDKIQATLQHSRSRVRELSPVSSNGPSAPTSRQSGLPSYNEATSPSIDQAADGALPFNADVMLEIADAQVFFITAEGYVSTPSYPSPLRICKFATQSVPGAPDHFLQIGSFTLPLIENLTPSLQASQGAYVFPDVTSTQEGAAVGILLDDITSADDVQAFESLIAHLTAMRQSQAPTTHDTPRPPVTGEAYRAPVTHEPSSTTAPPVRPAVPQQITESPENTSTADNTADAAVAQTRLSTKISSGLTTAAEWMNWGMEKGAEKLGGLMAVGGEKLRNNLKPANTEQPVDDKYQRGLEIARNTTNKVVIVSSYVVKTLGDATVALGKKAAPYIKTQAKKMMPENMTKSMTTKDQSGRSKVDDVIEVAGAGIKGFGVVYLGLETAAKALGRSIASQTSATAAHRYGHQIGLATDNVMYTLGNTLLSAHNVTQLGPKAIAKRAAKDTAKAVINPPPNWSQGQAHPQGYSYAAGQPIVRGVDKPTLEITELPSEEDVSQKPQSNQKQ